MEKEFEKLAIAIAATIPGRSQTGNGDQKLSFPTDKKCHQPFP